MNRLVSICVLLFVAICTLSACRHDPQPVPNPAASGDTTNTGTPADPANPRFTSDILPIFLANCSGCHNNTISGDGYVFISYETITAKKFVHGDPGKTKLYDAITDDDDEDRMPQAPNPRLPAEKILLIKNWIKNGAPNN